MLVKPSEPGVFLLGIFFFRRGYYEFNYSSRYSSIQVIYLSLVSLGSSWLSKNYSVLFKLLNLCA